MGREIECAPSLTLGEVKLHQRGFAFLAVPINGRRDRIRELAGETIHRDAR